MIKDIFSLVGFIFKVFFNILGFIMKGIGWYFKSIEKIFKGYPKKRNRIIRIKEEIL